jgi:hypothetical protein
MGKKRPFPNKGRSQRKETEKESQFQSKKDPRSRRNANSRGYDDEKNSSGAITKSGYSNDPNWYKRDGVLAIDSSNISTYTPIGVPYNVMMKGNVEFTPSGILRLDYLPHFGDIDGPTHPLMLVARDLYDFVNARNSRSSSYDPSDLMLYCIAVANAWVLHAAVRRIVGMFNTYSVLNRYWWDSVLETMNIAPISATNGITQWVNLANRMALVLNTLAVPKDITYFSRAQFMCESVFADAPTAKCSLYYFMPTQLFRYSYDQEGKGYIRGFATPWANIDGGRNVTPDKVETYFNDLVKNLINDTDISYMKADIRKAFGEDGCYTLPQIDERFQHGYVFDGVVNLQTRNATIMNFFAAADGYTYELRQDMETNSLVSDRVSTWMVEHADAVNSAPSVLYNTRSNDGSHIFDFPVEDVSNDLWIEATKLHSYFDQRQKFHANTEVLVRDTCYVFTRNPSTGNMYLTSVKYAGLANITVTQAPIDMAVFKAFADKLEMYSKFAAAPIQWIIFHSNPSYKTGDVFVYLNEDLTNWTTLDVIALNKMVDSAHLSLFSWRDLSR